MRVGGEALLLGFWDQKLRKMMVDSSHRQSLRGDSKNLRLFA